MNRASPQDFGATWDRYVRALDEFRTLEREKAARRQAASPRDPRKPAKQPTPLEIGPL